MGPPRNSQRKPSKDQNGRDAKKDKKKPGQPSSHRSTPQTTPKPNETNANQLDLSTTIPLTLQQLLLNVFKTGLLSADGYGWRNDHDSVDPPSDEDPTPLDLKSLIQTIKSHLYHRDFDSAFTDASEDLLRAYALRWSASRALGYAGVLKALLAALLAEPSSHSDAHVPPPSRHVVCIGGGAGAEIVALAAVWRDLLDEARLAASLAGVSLQDAPAHSTHAADPTAPPSGARLGTLSVTAVDIADWSRVVDRLACAIRSAAVPGSKTHPAPLHGGIQFEGRGETDARDSDFTVRFRRADVLSIPDAQLSSLLRMEEASTAMVTLMFTLNELFSTSMAKATGFLLRMTDLLCAGTLLVVVDSPGSYSTLKLGKGKEGDGETAVQERKYPMKFLLDHALLSVASGKWERVLSQDSRWWRREAARLRYDVGEGAGLEDMRFQVHIYRRLDG